MIRIHELSNCEPLVSLQINRLNAGYIPGHPVIRPSRGETWSQHAQAAPEFVARFGKVVAQPWSMVGYNCITHRTPCIYIYIITKVLLVVWNMNFIFHILGTIKLNNNPNWLIFLKMFKTTNQISELPTAQYLALSWVILGSYFATPPNPNSGLQVFWGYCRWGTTSWTTSKRHPNHIYDILKTETTFKRLR